jgi:hypothetical protein
VLTQSKLMFVLSINVESLVSGPRKINHLGLDVWDWVSQVVSSLHALIYISNVTVRWTIWNYAISGYPSNEFSCVNTLHERKLWCMTRTSEKTCVSVYLACSVSTDNLMWVYEVHYLYYIKETIYDWLLLFMGGSIKRQPRSIIYNIGFESNAGERRRN